VKIRKSGSRGRSSSRKIAASCGLCDKTAKDIHTQMHFYIS
jgi:hypothetical protein